MFPKEELIKEKIYEAFRIIERCIIRSLDFT